MLHKIRLWHWKRRYRTGRTVTQFLAPDIRRDVEVLDASRIDAGVITARTRTWNVLYAIKGLAPEPPFGEVRTVEIRELWKWSGAPWGGPVPDSTDGTAEPRNPAGRS